MKVFIVIFSVFKYNEYVKDWPLWKQKRKILREMFEVMDKIFSIDDMENGIMENCFE